MTLRSRLILIFSIASLLVLGMGAILVVTQYTFAVGQVDEQIVAVQKQAAKVVKFVDAGGSLPVADDVVAPTPQGTTTTSPTATAAEVVPNPTPLKTKGKKSGGQKTPGQKKNTGQQKQQQSPQQPVEDTSKVPLVPNAFVGMLAGSGEVTAYSFELGSSLLPDAITGATSPGQTPKFLTVAAHDKGQHFENMRIGLFKQDQSVLVVGISLAGVTAATVQLATNAFIAWLIITTVLLVAYLWVNRLGVRPIRKVTDVAQLINEGDKNQRVPVFPAKTEAQALGETVNDLLDENQRVENKLRQFVSDAAHELRTPLTAITGYSALYGKGKLASETEVSDAMRRINEESSRMARLVNDLLTLTTIDQEAMKSVETVDVVPLVDDVLNDMRVIDSDRDFLRTGDSSAHAAVDTDLFTQLLVILLTNAQDHGPEGTPITVHVAGNGVVRIGVRDEGPGIPRDQQDRIFERFARVEDSRKRVAGRGTGLGLAIAKAISIRLGGTVGVTSQSAHEGRTFTNFWFEIPSAPRNNI